MLHTKCKIRAGHNCLLRPREQDAEVPPSTAFRFLASADIRRHLKGQTITQDKELPRRSRQKMCESSMPSWSLGVRDLHSSFIPPSIYLLCHSLRSDTHQRRGLL